MLAVPGILASAAADRPSERVHVQSALEAREILVESADVHPAVEKRPGLGRIVLGSFFIVMAIGVNIVFVLVAPYGFVNLGTDAPLIPLYQWAFEHVVATAPALFGLLVAAFEIVVGLLMIKGGKRTDWGLIGGMIFLVAITPLGPWTLPNLIMASALGVLLRRRQTAVAAASAA